MQGKGRGTGLPAERPSRAKGFEFGGINLPGASTMPTHFSNAQDNSLAIDSWPTKIR